MYMLQAPGARAPDQKAWSICTINLPLLTLATSSSLPRIATPQYCGAVQRVRHAVDLGVGAVDLGLQRLGLCPFGSAQNMFLFVEVAHPLGKAEALKVRKLSQHTQPDPS